MLWMLGLHHWLVLECFELFLPWLVYDWTDFNLLVKVSFSIIFSSSSSSFFYKLCILFLFLCFFFLACVCCDLFICEKVNYLFDKGIMSS
jgi:hypothetical protein